MAKTERLQFFDDPQAVRDYVVHELICTLEDDLYKMEDSERSEYTSGERKEMRKRLHDIRLMKNRIVIA